MSTLALRTGIAAAFLLQACAAPPPRAPEVHPALQVSHAANETAEAFYQLGRLHHEQGELDVAMTGYAYAIARDPHHLAARSAAAAIHAQQGRLEQARALMLAVVADYPTLSQPRNNLGYIDYLRGDHAGAVREIGQALALDPRNERARNNLALAEAGLAGEPVAPPALAAMPAMPAPPAAPAPSGQLALVQLVPNIYELRRPAAPPTPALVRVAPVPASAMPARAARVEVVNADGSAGLARRVGTLFGQHGFPVARLSNLRPFGLRATRIEYRPDYQAQADAMRKLIDGPVRMAQMNAGAGDADVKVVLGRDTGRALALQGTASASLALR